MSFKRNIRHFLPLAMLLTLISCGNDTHFITNRAYRGQVHRDFLYRQELAQGRAEALFSGMDTLCRQEREALEFLYAYMPYSDLADYDQQFYLQQIRTVFAARDTFSWGRQVPEDIFRHFVLVYRVNNENLDTARMVFFNELKERVKGLTMEQAALEVNHWCHEHVAYRAADARTSAPLATMRTSLGRCGEESTFTVTALRAVGIPARQCYTPRWAHCDDNHAWVEVWVTDADGNGTWKHLGACEPDPELDMGWFDIPSTRCMMVHSKAFGRYQGDEEVVKSTPLYSELNLLSHYAPTRKVTVTVTWAKYGDEGPVADAEVKFKLYNYNEYYTLATVKTDANGQASLTTGLGDLLIWACKGDVYGYEKLDVRQQDSITIFMDHEGLAPYHVPAIEEFHMVPPVPGEAKVTPSDEAVAANAKRIAYEDSLRAAYTATFPTQDNFKDFLPKEWYWEPAFFSDAQVWELLQKSEGNYAEMVKFFESWNGQCRSGEHIYDYLKSYSDKDLRDITAEVLESHVTEFDWADRKEGTCYNYDFDYEVYKKGLMPARISNELVRPWRKPLAEALKDIKDYEALKTWTKEHVAVDDTGNYYNCPISPMGVYQLRHADAHSRDIFYVAACRSLGIPAYLDNATNVIYVWNKEWQQVSFLDSSKYAAGYIPAKITLTYHGKEPVKPIYYTHFTLQKYEDGDFVTFDFEDDPRMESFPVTIEVDGAVYYCLSTGSRYPDGEVINRREYISFDDEVGDSVSREIIIPELVERVQGAEGQLDPNTQVKGQVTLAEYAGSKGAIIAFMGSHREPAKHLVKEILQHKGEFEAWGGRILCTTTDPKNSELLQLPNCDILQMGTGDKSSLEAAVAKNLNETRYEYPLVLFVDSYGRVLFHSTGYKIGLADLLLKYCK